MMGYFRLGEASGEKVDVEELKEKLKMVDRFAKSIEVCGIEPEPSKVFHGAWTVKDMGSAVLQRSYTTVLNGVALTLSFDALNDRLKVELVDDNGTVLEYLPVQMLSLDGDELSVVYPNDASWLIEEIENFIDYTERYIENPEEYF